jgi:dienelactone hydrolase
MKKFIIVIFLIFILTNRVFTMSNFLSNQNKFILDKSDISADLIVEKAKRLGGLQAVDDKIYYLEGRPSEKGRSVLIEYDEKKDLKREVLPKEYNVRTLVNEYGGGAYLVTKDFIVFSNFSDKRLYLLHPDVKHPDVNLKNKCIPITPNDKKYYYAEPKFDETSNNLYCIRENHEDEKNVITEIVKIDLGNFLSNSNLDVVHKGYDFYSSIDISKDGKKLCFLAWNHPDMPWDNTFLKVVELDCKGFFKNEIDVNIEKDDENKKISVFQPRWLSNSKIVFVSDKTGFYNIYEYDLKSKNFSNLTPFEYDIGYPQWVFGLSLYDFVKLEDKNGRLIDFIACVYSDKGDKKLALINLETKEFQKIETPFNSFEYVTSFEDKYLLFIGATSFDVASLIKYDLQEKPYEIIEQSKIEKSKDVNLDKKEISVAKKIKFPTSDNQTAYAYLYMPKNVSSEQKPPLIVKSHGGPTAEACSSLDLSVQFFTTRGFAVVDVDYRGSSGYGREYRDALNHKWGIYDVDDSVNVAKYLVDKNLVDENRLIIKGGSAGGYTTLAALTFRDVFSCGTSYYGISDLEALAKETHKFEKYYTQNLVAKYPEEKDEYLKRSPINFVEKLRCPVLLLQGDQDKIVPPDQSEKMYKALLSKNIATSYILFEGEGHGFRGSENIKKSLLSELYFYAKVLNMQIDGSDQIDENFIKIDNL